jgi:TetR/AcrR family transcriptional repressor of mexCD-oprJ operon
MPPTTRRRRSEAERNAATILDAAVTLLAERPESSMGAVADAARVSRQTVYAHFSSRRHLLDAAVTRALERAAHRIDSARLDDGHADEALRRVVATSWKIVAEHGALLEAARAELPPDVLRARHAPIRERLIRLVERGQREGRFDRDLTSDWLVAVFFALVHAAAEQRLDGADEAGIAAALSRSMLKAFRPARLSAPPHM